MKTEYTVAELNQTIDILQNFFDEVNLLDVHARKILDPHTLQPVSEYPSYWEDGQEHGPHTDIRCLHEKRRVTRLMTQNGHTKELQCHYVNVEGRELVLSLKAVMTESLSMDEAGMHAAARSLQEVNRNVYRDYVTGAFNREYLDTVYSEIVKKKAAQGTDVCFAMVSVDKLDSIHNQYGRSAVDIVMGYVVSLLKQQINMQVRDGLVAKLGGSCVVLSCEGRDYASFTQWMQELCKTARKECVVDIYKRVKFTFSVATADWAERRDWQGIANLLDDRLRAAREKGGDCLVTE